VFFSGCATIDQNAVGSSGLEMKGIGTQTTDTDVAIGRASSELQLWLYKIGDAELGTSQHLVHSAPVEAREKENERRAPSGTAEATMSETLPHSWSESDMQTKDDGSQPPEIVMWLLPPSSRRGISSLSESLAATSVSSQNQGQPSAVKTVCVKHDKLRKEAKRSYTEQSDGIDEQPLRESATTTSQQTAQDEYATDLSILAVLAILCLLIWMSVLAQVRV